MSHRRSELPGTASVFGTRRVADTARKVIRLINAITRDEANERIGAWFLWAKDGKDIDAAFRAVQILRDLDTIDPEEAAYLFAQLLRSGPVFMKLTDEAVKYLRAHGESEIAALFVDDPALFRHALKSAADSLIERKPLDEDYRRRKDKPARVAVVGERVLALSASSAGPEREAAWAALMSAMKGVSIEARVRAVSRLKEVGALSRAEHAALVHHLSTERYVKLAQHDREYRRRFRTEGLGPERTPSPLTRPERTQESQLVPRSRRIHVACLRQLGEHDLANLLLANSDAYDALVAEGDASMPDAADTERRR